MDKEKTAESKENKSSKKSYSKDERIAIVVLVLLIGSLIFVYGLYAFNRYREAENTNKPIQTETTTADSDNTQTGSDVPTNTTNSNTANVQSENLFTYSDETANFVSLPWVVDQKEAQLNQDLLLDENVEYIKFNFFDENIYLVQKVSLNKTSPSDYTWTGKIIDPTGFQDNVTIITINGILIATIPSKPGLENSYEVLPVDNEQTAFLVLKVNEDE